MPPTPITATHRLTFKYTSLGIAHKQQNYVDAVASADPTGFDLTGRGSFTVVPLSTIPDYFFTQIAPFFYPATASFDGWLLEKHVSGAYVFAAAGTTTIVPTAGPSNLTAMGVDFPGKDTDNKNIHFYLYDGNLGFPAKISSYAAASSGEKAIIDYLFAQGRAAVATDAFVWRNSRGDKKGARWLSIVFDTNQKLRRLHRIA